MYPLDPTPDALHPLHRNMRTPSAGHFEIHDAFTRMFHRPHRVQLWVCLSDVPISQQCSTAIWLMFAPLFRLPNLADAHQPATLGWTGSCEESWTTHSAPQDPPNKGGKKCVRSYENACAVSPA